jgi:hypothetical protein
MAKLIMEIEDGFKDGHQIITGKFDTQDAPQPSGNLPPLFTPAQRLMATIQRLWDAGVLYKLLPLITQDMTVRNQMVERAMAQAQEVAAEPPKPFVKPDAVDAECEDLPAGTINTDTPAERAKVPGPDAC